jgi:pyruvate dehydrogenase (quinone)
MAPAPARRRSTPIDFAKVAEGLGIRGFRVEDPLQCGTILDQGLNEPGPALVEAIVGPNDPLLPPKRMEKYAQNLQKALRAGMPGRDETSVPLPKSRPTRCWRAKNLQPSPSCSAERNRWT